MNTNNSFLQAIKILIKESINSAPYNRTKQAIIVSNNGDNTYDIRFDGKLYTNIISYPNTRSLPLKHIVKVIIPNNQASQMYISAEGSPLIYYPVGSYYETSDTTFDPNVTWGGTWVLETEGQVHISSGTNYSVNGALTNISDGGDTTSATGNHTLTISEIPSHEGHLAKNSGSYTGYGNATSKYLKQEVLSSYGSAGRGWNVQGGEITPYGMSRGGGGAHNHGNVSTMQPYIVVNRWHRTA